MEPKNRNMRMLNKFQYYIDDMDCKYCAYWGGKKKGCRFPVKAQKGLPECCCDEEKREALAQRRLKRRRGAMNWDG